MTLYEPKRQTKYTQNGSAATVRLSARDIRETTWRALVAAGTSAGEAEVAGEAVAFAEIHFGVGVDSALRELELYPEESSPVRLSGGVLQVIDDDAGRGLLLLAPLAVGIIAARPASAPVLLPGLLWSQVFIGLFIRHCGDGAPSFFGFEHRGAKLTHGCRVDSDTSFTVYDDEQLDEISMLNPRLMSALAGQPDGVVVASDFGGLFAVDAAVVTSPDARRQREHHVFGHGVHVDHDLWATLVEASERYLAEEP